VAHLGELSMSTGETSQCFPVSVPVDFRHLFFCPVVFRPNIFAEVSCTSGLFDFDPVMGADRDTSDVYLGCIGWW
jgi:hypothetical protein